MAINGFFVAAEFAFLAVDRDSVGRLADAGSRRARLAMTVTQRLPHALSGIQLGITVTSLLLGIVAESTFEQLLHPLFSHIPNEVRSPMSVIGALSLASAFQMVIGELVPKGLAIAAPVPTALATAGPIVGYNFVFSPMITVLNGAANSVVRALGIEPKEDIGSEYSIEEIELLIRSSGQEGTIDHESFTLLSATLRFGNKTAADALVPRPDVRCLPRDATVGDLVALSIESGHSRFPVIGRDIDDVLGVVQATAALGVKAEDRASTLVTSILQVAHFTPEGRDLETLLSELRANGRHMAVVVDEFGGTAGIVTLEDLLEEIVGEIEDEHDQQDDDQLASLLEPEGTFIVEGARHLDDVMTTTGLVLPEGDYETIAGFVLEQLGRIPVVGEQVIHDGWTIEVRQLDRRRIASIKLIAPSSRFDTHGGPK